MAEYERDLEARIEQLEASVEKGDRANKELAKIIYALLRKAYDHATVPDPFGSSPAKFYFESLEFSQKSYKTRDGEFIKEVLIHMRDAGYLDASKEYCNE